MAQTKDLTFGDNEGFCASLRLRERIGGNGKGWAEAPLFKTGALCWRRTGFATGEIGGLDKLGLRCNTK